MSTPPSAQSPAELLPLVFRAAPGWPTPTSEWVTTHLGWQPPPGWVPIDGCPDSPPRWQFWSRNEQPWAKMARPHVRAARRNVVAGLVLNVMAAGSMAYGLAGGPNWFLLIVGAVFFLTVSAKTSQAQAEVIRIEAALLEALRNQAEQLKADSDRAHYARDLRSSNAF